MWGPARFRTITSIASIFALWGGFQSLARAQVTVIQSAGKIWNPAGLQWYIRGAYNSVRDEYFVVWADQAPAPDQIKGVRVSSATALRLPEDSEPRIIGSNGGVTPDIAYNPTRNQYLVAWSQTGNIQARFLDGLGNFIPGSDQFTIAASSVNEQFTRIAYDEGHDVYMVVWMTLSTARIQMRMVNGDPLVSHFNSGATTLDGLPRSMTPNTPSVAWNPYSEKFMVAWTTVEANDQNYIRGQIFNWDGTNSFGPFTVANLSGNDRRPEVAANSRNGEFLISFDNGSSDMNVYGVIWNSAGTRIRAPFVISRAVGKHDWRSHAAYNARANQYFVTFNRGRGCGGPCDDILGKVIDTAGNVISGDVPVSGPTTDVPDFWESHGIEDGLSTWGGIVSNSDQPHILDLYLYGGDGVYASLIALAPSVTTLITVDSPPDGGARVLPFTISGWAIDTAAETGTGVDAVTVFARPQAGGDDISLGGATLGISRPGVGDLYGTQFTPSGYSLGVPAGSLTDGWYTLEVFARSTVTGEWSSVILSLKVGPDPQTVIDAPTAGATLDWPFQVTGWAIDRAATSGTGVDAVHVWAQPVGGGAEIALGAATLGISRPGVAGSFGSQFANSGFSLEVTRLLRGGDYMLNVYAHSTVNDVFNLTQVPVKVPSGTRLAIDSPLNGQIVGTPFIVSGWAINNAAPTGPGVDAVHVFADPVAGGSSIDLGPATFGISRPGVASEFGDPEYENSGYQLRVDGPLPLGSYWLRVFAHPVGAAIYDNSTIGMIMVTLASDPLMVMDTPVQGAVVPTSFTISGWAIDRTVTVGTGVDAVFVWAHPLPGGTSIGVGTAQLGLSRPGVSASYGANFEGSGYQLNVTSLPAGVYRLEVFAHSTVTQTWSNSVTADITVR